MSPRRTRRGTIRESVSEISINNSIQSTRSLRKIRNTNKSQNIRSSEEDSDNPVEINSSIANISSAISLDNTLKSTRKRKKKDQESLVNSDNLSSEIINESEINSSIKKIDSKNTKTKKQKISKLEVLDTNLLINEDESPNTKTKKNKGQVFSNNLTNNKEISQGTSKKKIKSDIYNTSLNKKNNRSVGQSSRKSSASTVNISDGKVTPKNSPINIPLNPHRSTKTPKKSPINLGSPKTHSRHFLKSLNVPRRLTISDSPPTSEESSNSILQQSSSNDKDKSINKIHKHKSSKLKQTSEKKKSVSPIFKHKPRFSKSPKIVFKTPKSKSKKSNKKSPSKKVVSKIEAANINSSQELETTLESSSLSNLEKDLAINLLETKKSSPVKVAKYSKTEKLSETVSPKKSNKSLIKSQNISINKASFDLEKSSEIILPVTSKKTPLKSPTTILASKSQSLKKIVPLKLKKSPKFISPLNSKKTPKIVLTLKSKKSPAKLSKTKSPKQKKSPAILSKSMSPKVKTSPSSKKDRLSVSDSARKSTTCSSKLSRTLSMSPRVIVNKLTTPEYKYTILNMQKNSPSINLVPVDYVIQSSSTLASTKVSIKDTRRSKSPKSRKRSLVTKATARKNDTPSAAIDKRLSNLRPLNSSTPRDRLKQKPFNLSSNAKARITKRLSNQTKTKDNYSLLDDESEPSMNDSSLIPMSAVFDSDNSQNDITFGDEKNKSKTRSSDTKKNNRNSTFEIEKNSSSSPSKEKSGKDNTYEVENPKTPRFQNKSSKRILDEAELSANEHESKRSCKVQFSTPASRTRIQSSGINRIGTPGHAIHKRRTPVKANELKSSITNQSITNKVEIRKRTNSVITTQLKTPRSASANKSPTKSSANTASKSHRTYQKSKIATINHLSKSKPIVKLEKKIEIKTPAKKIPNFAEIHQKNFSKMESLIDLKKRVEERHTILNAGTSSTKKLHPSKPTCENSKPIAVDSTNNHYNRFGFKMRKNDAIDVMSKKQTGNVDSREKKREVARSTLKGVRMNRRFELQMKSRMKNS